MTPEQYEKIEEFAKVQNIPRENIQDVLATGNLSVYYYGHSISKYIDTYLFINMLIYIHKYIKLVLEIDSGSVPL